MKNETNAHREAVLRRVEELDRQEAVQGMEERLKEYSYVIMNADTEYDALEILRFYREKELLAQKKEMIERAELACYKAEKADSKWTEEERQAWIDCKEVILTSLGSTGA